MHVRNGYAMEVAQPRKISWLVDGDDHAFAVLYMYTVKSRGW
jgi:hypothetical protein